jgi:hypothetical protein
MPNPTLRSTRQRRAGRPPSEVASLVKRAATGDERAWHALIDEFGNLGL